MLEASSAPCGVVEQETDEGFAVVDLIGGCESECLGEFEAEDLDIFVGLGRGRAFADVAREVELHPFTEEARAGKVSGEESPALGTVTGLFDEFAFGGGEGRFAGFDTACGEFDEGLARGVAVLSLEDDVWIAGVGGFVDGEDDDGAVVADNVAGVDVAAGLLNLVGEDGEDFALIGESGGDDAGFGGGFPASGGGSGCLSFVNHRAKVSSCI